MNKKQGISLIVLVITIVVIVILATAVILSIANNNPIGNASEAVEKNNESEYKAELSLYIAKQYADNQGDFKLDNLYAFGNENVNKIVTSMKDEDLDNYIIWQGELVKRGNDGCYYYENGEAVKTFDMQIFGSFDSEDESKGRQKLNQNMVEFLEKFEEIQAELEEQENYSEENKLIYNEGYITNCYGKKISTYKQQLPDGVVIKNYDLTSEKGDTSGLGTDDGIYYNDELVARFVVFGDVSLSTTCLINSNDATSLRYFVIDKGENCTLGRIIAAEVNGDGIVNNEDYELLKSKWSSWSKYCNQNRPAIIPTF